MQDSDKAYQMAMRGRYEVYQVEGASNGAQIVKERSTEKYYITLYLYADMIGAKILIDLEKKFQNAVSKDKVVYLGEDGIEGIRGKYLLPVESILEWMAIDNPHKAAIYATDCVKESLVKAFEELKELAENDK